LSAALVLIVIGITGAALAFRDDYVRWSNVSFFGVKPSGQPMSQDAIVAKIEAEYAPSRVESINIIWPDEYQYYFMNNRGPLIVNSIDGRILDPRAGEAFMSKVVINAHGWHTKLARGKIGQAAVDIATYEAVVLVCTGVFLWWRAKRFSVKWKASWHRRFWDLHNTIGIAVALPVFFLAFTGSLIALRLPATWSADSGPQPRLPSPPSAPLAAAAHAVPAPLDAALAAAEAALPGVPTYQVNLPESLQAPIAVNKSPGGWSTRNQRSTVYVDRYSTKVLRVDHTRLFSPAYKAYELGKRSHTGELFGIAGKAILGVSSLLFAVSAITGIALGLWKLSGMWTRSRARRRGAGPA
jgi:uncharacterized iron-regulated membrane protein